MSPTRIGGSPADGPHDEGNDGGKSAALHARGRALELSTTKATTVSAPAEHVKVRVLTLCNHCLHRRLEGSIFHWVIGFKAQSWQGHALARKSITLRRSGPASISPRSSCRTYCVLHLA